MKKVLISLVLFYKKHFSRPYPLRCIFEPTCSVYALDALEKYGAFKGSYLTIWRILRCNPFNKGRYDPVP